MWGILVALLSGALMSLQGIFNTEVTKQSSIWAAAGWVQMTALVTCVVLYFVTGRGEIWGMFSIDRKYMLLGGVMGAFITWTVIKSMDGPGSGEGDTAHRCDPDPCLLCGGGIWSLRCRESGIRVEKTYWCGSGDCWDRGVPVVARRKIS